MNIHFIERLVHPKHLAERLVIMDTVDTKHVTPRPVPPMMPAAAHITSTMAILQVTSHQSLKNNSSTPGEMDGEHGPPWASYPASKGWERLLHSKSSWQGPYRTSWKVLPQG